MADVLFRYLLAARSRDRGWLQRVFLADERLLAASVERLLETAAIRIDIASQHMREREATVVAWPSRLPHVQFYDKPEPRPPQAPQLETRSEAFPLRSTLQVDPCAECEGNGYLKCSCDRGRVSCGWCSGTGRQRVQDTACSVCGGDGLLTCGDCRGSGNVQHMRCGGEGKVATWREKIYSYTVKRQSQTVSPVDCPPRVAAAVEAWLEEHDEVLETLTGEAASTQLGYSTAHANAVVSLATHARDVRVHRAKTDPEECLFVETQSRCVPVSACVLRSERWARREEFWLVGRGAEAIELKPAARADRWKLAALPGLALGAASAAEMLAQLHGFSLLAPELLTGAAAAAATGLSMLGFAAAGIGFKRMWMGQGDPVRTIAVLPCAGQSTAYLSCLASIGAFVHRLDVLDRSYKTTLEALMGTARAPHQSQTIVLRTEKGELVRLIEIAGCDQLAPVELEHMARTVDGVVFLEQPGHLADELRGRLRSASPARPAEASLMLSGVGEPAAENTVDLERIRRAFTREIDVVIEWPAVFSELWSPVGSIVAGHRVALARRHSHASTRLPAEAR
jgi:hypothetical protein